MRPSVDPFYAPTPVPAPPGQVLRVRPVELTTNPHSLAWQVVYASTGTRDQPIAVSGTLLVPTRPWPGPGPRPIVSFGVGVHGLGRDAAPSYLLREGLEAELPLLELALAKGWAVAVSDGEGLGLPGPHTYGAGRAGGHAMLDIVRASIHCGAGLATNAPVLLWGYSEGGRCAAWAGERHPFYAPELPVLGIAAGGVPADLRAVAKAIDGGPFSGLGLAVLIGLAEAHQDPALARILSESGRVAAAHAATLDVVGLIVEHPEPMRHHTVRDEPWDEPAWRELLDRERNGRHRPLAPVYLYHVVDDQLVPTALGRQLRKDYLARGADVTWADVWAEEHLAGAFVGADGAVTWLAQQLSRARTVRFQGARADDPPAGSTGPATHPGGAPRRDEAPRAGGRR